MNPLILKNWSLWLKNNYRVKHNANAEKFFLVFDAKTAQICFAVQASILSL